MEIQWATSLYEFLRQCNASPLPKTVLDCGAGREAPPLSIFHQQGYRTCGIEIDPKALAEAWNFCGESNMTLNILPGDMRQLPFASEVFSFAYSFNAIFFMKKSDITLAMSEIERVMKPSGLCFVNFLSVDEPKRNMFNEVGCKQFDTPGFSYHEDDEPEAYFTNFEVLRKEKRRVEKVYEGSQLIQVTLEYIARKNEGYL